MKPASIQALEQLSRAKQYSLNYLEMGDIMYSKRKKSRRGKLIILLFIITAAFIVGCQNTREEINQGIIPTAGSVDANGELYENGGRETVLIADPAAAIADIYRTILDNPDVTEVTADTLEEVLGISTDEVESFVAFTSDARNGLSDIAIIRPAPNSEESIREALIQYGMRRADSFRNYDILNAHAIASNTAVYSQGDYIVMLMLSDQDAAIEIIDRYIPR